MQALRKDLSRPDGTPGGSGHGALLAAPALGAVLLIVVLPSLILVRRSFEAYDPYLIAVSGLTWENYVRFFTDPYYLDIFRDTVVMAVSCTLLALLLGMPLAYSLARSSPRTRNVLFMLIVFPMLIGNVIRAAGWMALLGNAGIVNTLLLSLGWIDSPLRLMYTPFAVALGISSVVLPYMVLILASILQGLDADLDDAARNLGAGALTSFLRVTLPLALPGVAAGTILVFILCMNAYATPVLLGGTGMTMLAPVLYEQIAKLSNWPFGAALATILLAATLALSLSANRIIHRRYRRGAHGAPDAAAPSH